MGTRGAVVCTVSNYLTLRNSISPDVDVRHHIPTISESVRVAPRFSAMMQRFQNVRARHYLVHVMGDFDPETLKPHFMRLESLLKKHAPSEEICGECRHTALEAADHRRTIGKNLIGVEMDSTGRPMCSFYSEDGIDEILLPPYISLNGCSTQGTLSTVISGGEVTVRARAKIACLA